MATGMLTALLAGGGMHVPPCALCEWRRMPAEPGERPARPATTLVLGTLVCAEHARNLASGVELLPMLLADVLADRADRG